MTKEMSRIEFNSLPLRDEEKGDYVKNTLYRASGCTDTVFEWKGDRRAAHWWAFPVSLVN